MGIISDGHGEVFPSCRPQKTRELGRYAHACANGWGTGVHTERPYGFCTQHDLYGRGAHCASAKMCANWHGPSGTPVPTVSAVGAWSVAGRDVEGTVPYHKNRIVQSVTNGGIRPSPRNVHTSTIPVKDQRTLDSFHLKSVSAYGNYRRRARGGIPIVPPAENA